jgi:hypothetical protein
VYGTEFTVININYIARVLMCAYIDKQSTFSILYAPELSELQECDIKHAFSVDVMHTQ